MPKRIRQANKKVARECRLQQSVRISPCDGPTGLSVGTEQDLGKEFSAANGPSSSAEQRNKARRSLALGPHQAQTNPE